VKLQRFEQTTHGGDPDGVTFVFWCPGCEGHHTFSTERSRRPVWTFNGNLERPTFSPSLLYPDKTPRCHLFLTDGRLQFLSDCGHKLAGQTVDLPEIPPDQRW
jgi:hypothetical protein